jgi:transcription-repair coupling factor (superfamily II helicase)
VALSPIADRIGRSPAAERLRRWAERAADTPERAPVLHVRSASGSLPAFLLADAYDAASAPLVCLVPDEDAAAYLHADLEQLLGGDADGSSLLRFPATQRNPYDSEQMTNSGPLIERADVLQQLADGFDGILITSVAAAGELVPPADTVQRETLAVETGDEVAPDALVSRLVDQGFKHVEFVERPGELAQRGGILDVFPYAGDYPVRIEFFGDEIDGLREFDPQTQRSVSRLKTARLVPNLERDGEASAGGAGDGAPAGSEAVPLFDYLPSPALLATFDEARIREEAEAQFERASKAHREAMQAVAAESMEGEDGDLDLPSPSSRYLDRERLEAALEGTPRVLFGTFADAGSGAAGRPEEAGGEAGPAGGNGAGGNGAAAEVAGGAPDGREVEVLDVGAAPQPSFNSNMDLVREQLDANAERGIDTFILCDSQGQASRLRDLLESEIDHGLARLLVESIHEGFEWAPGDADIAAPGGEIAAGGGGVSGDGAPAGPSSANGSSSDGSSADGAERGVAVYTDHQIFNRYHRPSTKKREKYQSGLSLRDVKNLTPGDFVVHVDHGIGKFAGMKKIEVRGKRQEAVRLNFADGDVLYVNVNALYKLNKYTGKEGHQPSLTKLGSGQWEKTKERTKSKVKDIARDLIKLYAKRKASDGYAFSSDTVWQREMEASFEFEDTPDQADAAEAVKRDMEEPVPMDRLVCGDVGFGKTEVAVRAAFKAAQDGKQVAVLVPTTILAEQHYETFSKRLERFPVRVDRLSRFRTRSEQEEILEDLANGTLDIVIGTHRLTSDDVDFDDLGLLVIDEEQRFGVKTKESLRKMREDVDTLTLTATPIPRTLQFSLLGARDLSIISTPPPNRQSIVTEIHTFDKDLIRDAIVYEKSRGGQVFFIHNRVKTIHEVAEMVRSIAPGVRVRVGHGQMKSSELEDVMMGFIEEDFDVLVSTSIIENGLDISNANTMIINRADWFGLSELHQLRGRVGRSERRAFCYLLVPSIHSLTDDARERLKAVEEFSDLGSGFNLAMRDLDIRGAGSLLGAEQSGFIEDVGYETYHKILDEAIQELREEEFEDVFDGEAVPPGPETSVDVEEDAYIPDDYLSNNVERLNLYRRISDAPDEETLEELRDEMTDRFGPVPEAVNNLLTAARIRLLGEQLRLPKVVFKNERLFLYLPSENADPYFYDEVFHPLLEKLNDLEWEYVLKDQAEKNLLRAIVQDVPDLDEACLVLDALLLEDVATVASTKE